MRFTVDECAITVAAMDVVDASLLLADPGLSDIPGAVIAALPGSLATHVMAAGLTDVDNGLRSLVPELARHAEMLRCAAHGYDKTETTAAAALAPFETSCDPAP